MSILDRSYPDTYEGGQQCKRDVDSLSVILHGKEPEGYSQDFLLGFRNPHTKKDFPWDERGWRPGK